MNIFPELTLTQTEKDIIAETFSKPEVKKYLNMIAYNIGSDIVKSVIDVDEPEESWLRKEIFLKGQLRTIDMLLSIQPKQEPTN